MKSTLLIAAGCYSLLFAAFHLTFWKLFRWKVDLARLMPVNRAIMQVLNIRLTYVFLVIGVALLLFEEAVWMTPLGKYVLGTSALFWFMRAAEQVVFFDMKTAASIIITIIFLAGSVVFLLPAVS